jgi:HEAT repeat protein
MTVSAVERVKESFLGGASAAARDGLDFAALAALTAVERAEVEALLLPLINLEDSRPIIALGELRTKAAVKPIRELLPKAKSAERDGFVLDMVLALWKIEQDSATLPEILRILAKGTRSPDRLQAAMELKRFACQEVAEALQTALQDENSLVRHHAARSLLAIHGLLDEAKIPPFVYQIIQPDTAVQTQAIAELKALIGDKSLPKC